MGGLHGPDQRQTGTLPEQFTLEGLPMRNMFAPHKGVAHFYPWQRESRVMLNEGMERLKRQIARLEREMLSRGSKRPDQMAKLVQLHGDATAKAQLVAQEIVRREALAVKRDKDRLG
jgi:hypothetical protein